MLSILTALLLTAPAAAQQAPTPFKSETEVVAIEVTAIDAAGNPVPDLGIADFEVTVAGRRRPIQSVQFIRAEPATSAPPPREAGVSTNQLPTSGRMLLLVVDESNMRPGANLPVMRAAEMLLERLSPGDVAGVARIPDGGGIEFTHDRARVTAALRQISGRPPRPRTSRHTVYISEAADYADTQRMQWPAAVQRECGQPTDLGYGLCLSTMQTEAIEILREEEVKRATFTSTVRRLIQTASAARTPVTMVLISEGLFVGRDSGALAGLASEAAFARVSLNVIRPMGSAFDAGNPGFSSDPAADNDLRRQGLERLAADLRGGYYEVSSTGAAVFDRIGRELSGYYLLGIEPTKDDRTSRARPLRVSVKRPGVTTRARAAFALPPPAANPANVTEQLREMLKAPAPARGLPMALASHVIGAGPGRRLRLLIAAEIGDAIEGQATYHVGLLVLGPRGDHIVSTAGTLRLEPSRRTAASPALFTTSVEIEPGDYSVRLAAVAADGRAGSIQHSAPGVLRKLSAGFAASDLIVAAEPPSGQFPLFNPRAIVEGPGIAALIEIEHDDAAVLEGTRVRFELAPHRFAARAAPAVAGGGGHRRMFSMTTPVDLAAGEYEIRAVVTPPSGEPIVITRAFRYEPPLAGRKVEIIREGGEHGPWP